MAEPNPSVPNVGGATSSSTGQSSGAPPNIQKLVASKRLQQAQAQVGEVVDIMRVNVEKVLERDQKISELDKRADDLQEGASQFQQQAVKLKRKYWWENIKMWIVIGVVVLVVVVIVIVSTTGGESGSAPAVTGEVVTANNNIVNSADVGGGVAGGPDVAKIPPGVPPSPIIPAPTTA